METLWQDVRYGLRQLARSPGFTAVAVLTLALGIGANTAIFSVLHAVLLKPLPYPDAERLVMIWNSYGTNRTSNSPPDYFDRVEGSRLLESIAAFQSVNFNLTGLGEPVRLEGARVTASFFPTLGVEPSQGRVFLPEEDQLGRDNIVVLSHGCWMRRFGGDPTITSSTLRLDDRVVQVAGVMPAHFSLLFPQVEVWMPLAFGPEARSDTNRGWEYLSVLGRFRHGATLEQVRAEMSAIAAASMDKVPSRRDFLVNAKWGAQVVPLREQYAGDLRPVVLVLFGAVLLVLLIACANVANLLLARAAAREYELSIRAALGAGPGRILRQLLVENLCLSVVGGLAGLLLAAWGLELLRGIRGAESPLLGAIGLHPAVLGFAVALTVGTTLFFGLVPALSMSSRRLFEGLRGTGKAGGSSTRQTIRRVLVVSEVALALLLLVGAGLLLRSFQQLLQVNPGFESQGRLTFRLTLPATRYPEKHRQSAFHDEALARLGRLPGVVAVGTIQSLPLAGTRDTATIHVEDRPVPPGGEALSCEYRFISPNYLRAMGIPLLKGRTFSPSDTAQSPLVVLVDERAARRFWPGEDPIGKRLGFSPQTWREVIGVVGSVHNLGLEVPGQEQVYIPHAQNPLRSAFYVVQTQGRPEAVVASVRATVQEMDAGLPLYDVETMEQRLTDSMGQRRLVMSLLAGFAGVALLLACVGIYGVISYLVRRRTHEFGIRLALGAQPGHVLRLAVRQGMVMALVGFALGILGAAASARLLEKLLFEVQTHDALTFAGSAVLVLGVTLVACWIPARRAARVDPMVALRYE
jgi:predicted permease